MSTSLAANAKTYTIVVTGTLPNAQFKTTTFQLIVVDSCPSATLALSSSTIASYTYYVTDTSISFSLPTVTSTKTAALCGSLYKTLTYANGTAFDSSVIAFSSSTPSYTIHTSLWYKAGTYPMLYSAYQGTYTAYAKTVYYTLTIVYITPMAIADES